MPQMNKGGKFIFGLSVVRDDLTIRLPPQVVEEYNIASEGNAYLFTGSERTGGFCITRKGLLEPSKLGHILAENPELCQCQLQEGEFLRYKGRSYCWLSISEEGKIQLTEDMLTVLGLRPGMELLSIRSSNIAFTMGAKGPLLQEAECFDGRIERY